MAKLLIKDKQIVLTVVLQNYLGDEDLKDYLRKNLPDARCEFTIGSSGLNCSFDEYVITIDTNRESVLLLILHDFCQKNNISHPIDIAD